MFILAAILFRTHDFIVKETVEYGHNFVVIFSASVENQCYCYRNRALHTSIYGDPANWITQAEHISKDFHFNF